MVEKHTTLHTTLQHWEMKHLKELEMERASLPAAPWPRPMNPPPLQVRAAEVGEAIPSSLGEASEKWIGEHPLEFQPSFLTHKRVHSEVSADCDVDHVPQCSNIKRHGAAALLPSCLSQPRPLALVIHPAFFAGPSFFSEAAPSRTVHRPSQLSDWDNMPVSAFLDSPDAEAD